MNPQKTVLVTGVSSGIGKAIATLLSDKGFRVFGTQRKPPQDEPTSKITLLPLDVRDPQSVQSGVDAVLRQAGRIDALVNNAGYALIGAAEETTLEEAQQLFETNFFGVLRMTRAVLPIFRRQGYGRIVNIGSVAGFAPTPYQAIYSASKHALEGYTESLDYEVRQFGIRVSVIEPGFIRTNITLNSQVAANLLAPYAAERSHVDEALRKNIAHGDDPQTVASVVLQALTSRSPRQVYLAGSDARMVSLARKFAPSGMFDKGLRRQFGLASV
jgi:NAD(P)-dependent dehydrogenase (short-subunit alcohol dehydrogenase family)